MCKYCEKVNDGIYSNNLINGSISEYAAEVYISNNYLMCCEWDGREESIKINYCPICGRNL